MSAETMEDLNTQTLIGAVAERGPAWHRRDDLQGNEDNHYPGLIPADDVKRRLFDWEPLELPVAYLIEAAIEDADFIDDEGIPRRVIKTQQGRVGVVRSDTERDLGVFMGGSHPSYVETLMRGTELLLGETLGITSAGLLAKGARAWVEVSVPETLHDDKSGISYRPNLLSAASMDGSLSLTRARTITATVCDNTMSWNLTEADDAGVLVRRKHTSRTNLNTIADERVALGIINEASDAFLASVHQLIEAELTRAQRIEVMDILVPLPEEEGRAYTLAENKRAELLALDSNPMVEPWVGNAWGEVQRYNTHQHWFANVRGTGRSERNTWRAINGKAASADREVVDAIGLVLAKG